MRAAAHKTNTQKNYGKFAHRSAKLLLPKPLDRLAELCYHKDTSETYGTSDTFHSSVICQCGSALYTHFSFWAAIARPPPLFRHLDRDITPYNFPRIADGQPKGCPSVLFPAVKSPCFGAVLGRDFVPAYKIRFLPADNGDSWVTLGRERL